MKTFENQWVLGPFEDHPTFFTKRMFGGMAVYLFGRQMMLLVEPTKSGRWDWHGILVCTDYEHQASICSELPPLAPHEVLKKWLFLDSGHEDFEATAEKIARCIASDDPRFGIVPKQRERRRRGSIREAP